MAACAWWTSRACHYVRRLKAVCEQAQGQLRLDLRHARSRGRDLCAPASPRSSGPCPLATMAVTQCSMRMLLHVASAIHERLHACTSACCYPQAGNPFQCTSAALSCAAARFCVEEPFALRATAENAVEHIARPCCASLFGAMRLGPLQFWSPEPFARRPERAYYLSMHFP